MQVSQFMASHAPQPSTFSQENPQNSQNGLNGHQPEPASDNKATNGSSAAAASGKGEQNGTASGFRALDVESVKHYLAGKPALAACLGDPKDAASWQVQLVSIPRFRVQDVLYRFIEGHGLSMRWGPGDGRTSPLAPWVHSVGSSGKDYDVSMQLRLLVRQHIIWGFTLGLCLCDQGCCCKCGQLMCSVGAIFAL